MLDTREDLAGLEQTDDSFFSKESGEGTDSHIERVVIEADASFLRDISAVGEQSGEHFEASDDVGGDLTRQLSDVLQDTVDAPGDIEVCFIGDDVQVAGALCASGVEQSTDHLGHPIGVQVQEAGLEAGLDVGGG